MRKRLRMEQINRTYLYSFLGFGRGDRIPPSHCGRYENIPMRDYDGNIIFHTTVYIHMSGRSKHRVYVQCPICKSFYGFSRLRQHINSALCDAAFISNIPYLIYLEEQKHVVR